MYEPFLWQELDESIIIGVDEVGRGCLAGPVYSACAIIDTSKDFKHFKDSKSLSAKRREALALDIEANHRVVIGEASLDEIAELNILHASLLSMKRAFLNLDIPKSEWKNCHLLVDGKITVPGLPGLKQTPLIKGDQRATPIAAASIFAKVKRDKLMTEYGALYPEYGFQNHKSYATKEHKEAIQKNGPCKYHRKTFAGVREFWSSN